MMSDTGNQLHTRSRRPKRSLTKTSDDNVLGISWKEERELRRAIYVSLRDQHNVSPGQSWMISKLRSRQSSHTNRPGNPRCTTDSPSGTYLLRGSRHRFSPITSNMTSPGTVAVTIATRTLRRAKLRATARLNGIVSSSARPQSPDWAAAALAHGTSYAESSRRPNNSVSATRAVRNHRNSTESPEDSSSRTTSSLSIESSVSSRVPGGRSKKPASTRNSNKQTKVMRTTSRHSSTSTGTSRGGTAGSRISASALSTSNDKRNSISSEKRSSSSNKRTVTTVPSRRRSQPNRISSDTRACMAPSKASIKNRIAKKLVSAAATKAKKRSQVSGAAKCQERASVSPDSTPEKENVVRSDRRVSLNRGSSPMDPASVRRPPALVPAELCQDPNGQPVSVHDFIEFVCYHGTPCLSPRLAWFSEPRTGRTCLGTHCSNELAKLEDSDLLNTRASRRCIATATPPKHCTQDPVQSTNVASNVESQSAFGDPVVPSTEDSISAVNEVLVLAKSPSVSVAKKMASINHIPSVKPPKIDLFAALSRSMKPDTGQSIKSDNGDSTHNASCEATTDKLPSKKIVEPKRSARCPPQSVSRTRRGQLV